MAYSQFKTEARQAWLARQRETNRAFISRIRSQTYCEHCGKQPIDWHRPEHLQKRHFRVGTLAGNGTTSQRRLLAEIAACTPLCRSCHEKEDMRLREQVSGRKRHPRVSRLTVFLIRDAHARGVPIPQIAREQKVHYLTVWHLIRGDTYRGVM